MGTSETKIITANKITLKDTPAVGEVITVRKVDEHGRDGDIIALGDPSSQEDAYSIVDKVLTFHTSLKGSVRVYYKRVKDVQIITSKPTVALNYRIESDMIVKDVETKSVFIAKLIVPNAQIQENFNITGSNEATEPAPIPLAIDCLEDSLTGKFYEILFYEDDQQQ